MGWGPGGRVVYLGAVRVRGLFRTKFDVSWPRKVEPPVESSNFCGLEMERNPFHF